MDLKRIYGGEVKYLFILFIIAIIIRLIVFNEVGDHPGDGAYRIILTINWLKDPYFITGDLWPPLHLYLSALAVEILGDPFNSIRLVSLIFGTIIIFPYYYLVKSLFDKRVATISTLILTFLSIHVQYSTYSMSEVPFAFFLTISLYFFFRFKREEKKKINNLIISAIFLNIASMTRYEAWLFIPLLTILVLNNISDIEYVREFPFTRNKVAIYFYTFLIISSIFPILWTIGNYHLYGDPFYGQSWSDNWIRTNAVLNPDSQWLNPPLIKKLTTWPGAVFHTLNIVSIFAGIGLLISLYKKRNLEFLSIFIILIGIFTYKLINVTMLPQPRHFIMPILFIIPFFTIGLDYALDYSSKFLDNKNDRNRRKFIPILIIGVFIVTSSYTAIVKNPYIIPGYVFDVSNWLKDNVKSSDTVLLDEYNWWSLHILIFSGLNTTFTEDYLKTYEFVTEQVRIIPGGGKKIDETTLIKYLENKPTYLVYFPKGKLGRILNISSESFSRCQNEVWNNYSFECKYAAKNYNIYELK